ncbi:MAG: hypothetical protein K0Q47_63 [Sedimentibacter sp.]|jgi:hypothetical protein|nr:hypothetical protein [Sedimentibacter sp.]
MINHLVERWDLVGNWYIIPQILLEGFLLGMTFYCMYILTAKLIKKIKEKRSK